MNKVILKKKIKISVYFLILKFSFLIFFAKKRKIFAIQHEILRFILSIFFLLSLLLTVNSHHLYTYMDNDDVDDDGEVFFFLTPTAGDFWWGSNRESEAKKNRVSERKYKEGEKKFSVLFCKAKWTFWDKYICWACVRGSWRIAEFLFSLSRARLSINIQWFLNFFFCCHLHTHAET